MGCRRTLLREQFDDRRLERRHVCIDRAILQLNLERYSPEMGEPVKLLVGLEGMELLCICILGSTDYHSR